MKKKTFFLLIDGGMIWFVLCLGLRPITRFIHKSIHFFINSSNLWIDWKKWFALFIALKAFGGPLSLLALSFHWISLLMLREKSISFILFIQSLSSLQQSKFNSIHKPISSAGRRELYFLSFVWKEGKFVEQLASPIEESSYACRRLSSLPFNSINLFKQLHSIRLAIQQEKAKATRQIKAKTTNGKEWSSLEWVGLR